MKAEETKATKSVKQYLYMIMPYLSDMINDHKATKLKSNKSWNGKFN